MSCFCVPFSDLNTQVCFKQKLMSARPLISEDAKWYHMIIILITLIAPSRQKFYHKKMACKIIYLQYNLKCICIMLTKQKYFFFIFGCAGSSLLLRLFFSCSEQGLLSSFGAQASHCGGFCCCSSQALEHRLSNCGVWV